MSIEVSEATFEAEVLERSREITVVVDFWASWCAPCRVLRPVLEQAVAERSGQLMLAAVDVDANPRLSQLFGIRGIPAVKAFRDGAVASEFTGALPAPQVARFLDELAPSPADRLVTAGDVASLEAAVELDPANAAARLALARARLGEGDAARARELLVSVEHLPGAAGLLAELDLAELDGADGAVHEAVEALRRRRSGQRGAGDDDAAADALLRLVRGGGEAREPARLALVGLFDELGDGSPVTAAARPRLAAALY